MHATPNHRPSREAPVVPPLAPPRRGPRDQRATRLALLAVILLAAAGTLILLLTRHRAPTPATPASIQTAAPAKVAQELPPAHAVAPVVPAVPAVPAAAVTPAVPDATTATNMAAAPEKAPEAAVVRRLRRDRRAPCKVVPGLRRGTNEVKTLATLRTTSERVMSQLLRTRPGDPVIEIGLGRNFAADFAASLTNMIEIYETDTQADAEHKEAIAWMKDGMRQMVEQGESPEAILTAYRQQLNELADYRRGLQQQLNALRRAGDAKAAETFVTEANKILEELGARPLALPRLPARRE